MQILLNSILTDATMNWIYCLLIGHTLIALTQCRPDAIPAASMVPNAVLVQHHQDVNVQANGDDQTTSTSPQTGAVEPKAALPTKMLRANVVVELAAPNATTITLPTSAPAASEFGDKIKLPPPPSAAPLRSHANPSKRYIKNLVYKPRTNITAKHLGNYLPTPYPNSLERPIYTFGTPATQALALNHDILNRLNDAAGGNQALHTNIRNAASQQDYYNSPYDRYELATSRPDTIFTPTVQSIYQNLNYVAAPPPSVANTLSNAGQFQSPPAQQMSAQELQQVLLRNKIQQQINALGNLGSISVPVANNYPIGMLPSSSSSNAATTHLNNPLLYIPNAALAASQQQQQPIYGVSHNIVDVADKFFYTPTTPSPNIILLPPTSTTEIDPYHFYERIPLMKNGQQHSNGGVNRKPAPLKQPVVHIGYTKPPKSHLSSSPNIVDTITHSHNNKNTSETHWLKTKTELYVNDKYVADLDNGPSQSGDDSNWSSSISTGTHNNKNGVSSSNNDNDGTNENDNTNGKPATAQETPPTTHTSNNKMSGSSTKTQGNNNTGSGDSNSNSGKNDVKIFISIDDKKNGNANNNNNNDNNKKSPSTKDRKGGNHGNSHNNHGGHGNHNNHGNNHGNHGNHGGNHGNHNNYNYNDKDKKKRRKGMKKPEPMPIQTILLQRPPEHPTTTTMAPLKQMPVVVHKEKYGYLDKFLQMIPILSLLKPLSFGFWTLALSPLLVVAAGGVAIAVILYPWLTLSHEHQVVAQNSRPPSVVIHRHSSPVVHVRRPIIQYRRPVVVRPIRKKRRPHTTTWSDRADHFSEIAPKTMQNSLEGILEGQFIQRETPKKNLLRRLKRNSYSTIVDDVSEDTRDRDFRKWLLALNNFESNILMSRY